MKTEVIALFFCQLQVLYIRKHYALQRTTYILPFQTYHAIGNFCQSHFSGFHHRIQSLQRILCANKLYDFRSQFRTGRNYIHCCNISDCLLWFNLNTISQQNSSMERKKHATHSSVAALFCIFLDFAVSCFFGYFLPYQFRRNGFHQTISRKRADFVCR